MTHEERRGPDLSPLPGTPILSERLRRRLEAVRLARCDLLDRLAVALDGGLRVRVLRTRGPSRSRLEARAHGRVLGPPPDCVVAEILALGPDGPGVIDLHHDGKGDWTVQVSGELGNPRFRQRLRNVLVNS